VLFSQSLFWRKEILHREHENTEVTEGNFNAEILVLGNMSYKLLDRKQAKFIKKQSVF